MPLFDFCFNFTSSKFRDNEQAIIQRALNKDVTHFFMPGSDIDDSQYAVELAEQHQQGFYAGVGVHPHNAKAWEDDSENILRKLASSKRVLAIGEAGLDYNRNFSSQEQQELAFRQQIELAIELQMPLFLHERDAHNDFYSIIQEYINDIGPTAVHCFTGSEEALHRYIALGFYIGITGWICDERRGTHLHEIVQDIPENRLLIETDAPYLFPRTFQPRPKSMCNEPSYLPHIAEHIAYHRGDTFERLSVYTMQNTLRFFGMDS
ncbi:MAG: TatD family hydrolase [Pseudomonadota bacterium]